MLAEILIRMVLEYLGVRDRQDHDLVRRIGSSRSAVRAIGASLPWSPDRTPSLNIPNLSLNPALRLSFAGKPSQTLDVEYSSSHVPSFADVSWIHAADKTILEVGDDTLFLPEETESGAACIDEQPEETASPPQDPEAMAKISALEVELANLRAQLAQVVKHQESVSIAVGPVSVAAPTPVCPAVAPPPPPPPPPPGLITPDQVNVIEQIRRSRAARKGLAVSDMPSTEDDKLDMGQVIKQIGSVKLRSVQRSPGGTPIRQKPLSDANDPATIIANALQRKFARTNLSPGPAAGCGDDDSDFENQEPVPVVRAAAVLKKAAAAPRRVISPRRKSGISPRSSKQPFGQHLLRKTSSRT
ncbi:mitochondrial fission regulator 1-like [Sycon ciliatum]|uniref:mitochondrial fission regulator 1-like n=1 Tax=Sycon ciliatum TaxID=27933 RepID=UPI0020AA74CC|eukprot:scpid66112/ scgid14097/ Mitochondrial fission regulator 1; Chondrocyte protein with a poly-proline region